MKDDEDDEDDGEDDDQHRATERLTRAEGGAEVHAARVDVAMPRRARGPDPDDRDARSRDVDKRARAMRDDRFR